MAEFSAVPDGIRGFATAASAMAAHVRTVAAGAAATNPDTLVPVFGIVGGDFLAAYAAAHGRYTGALNELADTLGSIRGAAVAAATAYEETDRGVAAGVVASGAAVVVPA